MRIKHLLLLRGKRRPGCSPSALGGGGPDRGRAFPCALSCDLGLLSAVRAPVTRATPSSALWPPPPAPTQSPADCVSSAAGTAPPGPGPGERLFTFGFPITPVSKSSQPKGEGGRRPQTATSKGSPGRRLNCGPHTPSRVPPSPAHS